MIYSIIQTEEELMNKNLNNLLLLGISFLIMGLLLLTYSISTYNEIKSLSVKIDFDELDNNNQMATSDKYFKYLSYADFLNGKLKKNKDLLIKNSSCVYLDYAEHNAMSLYKLSYNGLQTDESRKSVAAGNVRSLYNMLDNYGTCKQTPDYKSELKNVLDDIQKSETLYSESSDRMNSFVNNNPEQYGGIQQQGASQQAAIAGDSYSSNQNDSQNVYSSNQQAQAQTSQQPISQQPVQNMR